MSDIITAYPTSGLADRSLNSLNTAFFDYISAIPEIAEFFDSVTKIGDETKTSYSDFGIKFVKGNAYIQISIDGSAGAFDINNNSATSNYSPTTSSTTTVDIPVRHVTGINGTTVLWLDDYSKGVCMVFGKFGDVYFLANSMNSGSFTFYYSDTGGTVNRLIKPFNNSNAGTGGDYIAQPYYHLGINSGDIYTFDGGTGDIPYGKFKLGNAEFVRILSNFALRVK